RPGPRDQEADGAGRAEDRGGGPTGVCSQCESASEVCPACRVGYLVMREGWAGSFVGCSQYRRRSCRYTQPF
ncbi:MAG TPA: hypothetical protein VM597_36545, partial [Gemmataceae bacterium]|nr:hypothetical protein [Gemmataceae bacterium]